MRYNVSRKMYRSQRLGLRKGMQKGRKFEFPIKSKGNKRQRAGGTPKALEKLQELIWSFVFHSTA